MRSLRSTSVVAIVLMATSLAAVSVGFGAEDSSSREVGKLGRVEAITITGTKAFTADDLRESLAVDPVVLDASHPTAPLADYLSAIQTRIVAGYRYHGYLDAAAVASERERFPNNGAAATQVHVFVVEGKKYLRGAVRVTGAKAVEPAAIVRALTEIRPGEKAVELDPDAPAGDVSTWLKADGFPAKPQRALWKPTTAAASSDNDLAEMRSAVRWAYLAVGRRHPKFDLRIEKSGTTAELVVEIDAEGPPAIIREVEIVGNKLSSNEEIEKLLKVRGEVFDFKTQARIGRALWHSGRFSKYRLEFAELKPEADAPPPGAEAKTGIEALPGAKAGSVFDRIDAERKKIVDEGGGSIFAGGGKLVIRLVESQMTTPLGKSLSAEEEALLKLREWLVGLGARGEDLVIRGKADGELQGAFELIVSPREGLLATVDFPSSDPGPTHSYAFLSTPTVIGLYSFDRMQKLELGPTGSCWMLTTELGLARTKKEPFTFMLGLGVGTRRSGVNDLPLRMDYRLPPAVFASLATAKYEDMRYECRIVDGVLELISDNVKFRSDAATGKLLGVGFAEPRGNARIEMFAQKGALAAKRTALAVHTKELRNRYDESQSWDSILKFVARDPLWDTLEGDYEDTKMCARILRKALDVDLLPLMLTELDKATDLVSKFRIPNPDGYRSATHNSGIAEMFAVPYDSMPRIADRMFPPNSWARTLLREYALSAGGRRAHAADTLNRDAEAQRWGPLAYWTAAAGAAKFELPALTSPLAEQGLKSLDATDFERDLKPLLQPDYLSGQAVRKLVQFVRSLDEEEATLLVGAAQASDLQWVESVVEALRDDPKVPLEEALAKKLPSAWGFGLKERFAGGLKKMVK